MPYFETQLLCSYFVLGGGNNSCEIIAGSICLRKVVKHIRGFLKGDYYAEPMNEEKEKEKLYLVFFQDGNLGQMYVCGGYLSFYQSLLQHLNDQCLLRV